MGKDLDEYSEILKRMEELSKSTAPGGGGGEAYGKVLHDDFSRWTMGSKNIVSKSEIIESINGWFKDGWRVTDRNTENWNFTESGNYAFIRRKVTEKYLGPDDETSTSTSGLTEVWIKENNKWFLLRVDLVTFNE